METLLAIVTLGIALAVALWLIAEHITGHAQRRYAQGYDAGHKAGHDVGFKAGAGHAESIIRSALAQRGIHFDLVPMEDLSATAQKNAQKQDAKRRRN